MTQKLLSIVVPTKNRYYYLKYLIQLIEDLHSEDIEMVIQDNSDDNSDFQNYLNENKYEFIRYKYIKGQIPMSDNADQCILNSTGKYICFIGDDDGITKHILEAVKWMSRNDVEAIKSATLNYCWPDAPQGRSADLFYYPFTSKVSFPNPKDELIKSLKGGFVSRGDMPLAYHSIVSREALDRVFEICGTYFPGNSPDISNAVALSLVVKKYAIVDLPIAYSGSSAYKGGGVFAQGNSTPHIDEIPWFRPNPQQRWFYKLPKIAEGSIIWADSAIESLNKMKRSDLVCQFGLYNCYTHFILTNPRLTKYVLSVCDNKYHLIFSLMIAFLRKICNKLYLRVGWIFGFMQKPIFIKNINNIIEASKKLETLSDISVLKS